MGKDSKEIYIHWFRQDLRLNDNPAIAAAAKAGSVLPVYVLDDVNAREWKMGGASRLWLHHSLEVLNASLDGKLILLKGDAAKEIPSLAKSVGAKCVYWNRCYEPWRIARDKTIKENLKASGVEVESFNGSLLWEPWDVLKDDGTPYKVFTPFFRKGCLGKGAPRTPNKNPPITFAETSIPRMNLSDLNLLPHKPEPRWDKTMTFYTKPGEAGAMAALNTFLENGLKNYKEGRDFMAGDNCSRLSPHLHFGEISPHQVWQAAAAVGMDKGVEKDLGHFHSELGWREFSYSLLYHFPHLPLENMQKRFDAFPWVKNDEHLDAWKRGRTGYPVVDAAMRELWQTGYMHNRARMIVGSFLVKHLLLHWHDGEDWFWDCLFDADLPNNAASWQWIAGCGADAAPYFRVFNPITQGFKFDPDGEYVRRFVPELAAMPNEFIHKPWEATPLILKAAGVELGKTYPLPVVDHAAARERALDAFAKTK